MRRKFGLLKKALGHHAAWPRLPDGMMWGDLCWFVGVGNIVTVNWLLVPSCPGLRL